jgi:hypothetical protein
MELTDIKNEIHFPNRGINFSSQRGPSLGLPALFFEKYLLDSNEQQLQVNRQFQRRDKLVPAGIPLGLPAYLL